MWARRCGAPPTWPSRVKVLFFSFFSGTVGLSIYLYMSGSNISYLELDQPATEYVLCVTEWPQRSQTVSWSNPGDWIIAVLALNNHDLSRSKECDLPEERLRCEDITLPVHDINRPIALAMGDTMARYDVLSLWAKFFLWTAFAIWAGMTVHDLALIGRAQKDFILDVSGVNKHCPSIRNVWRTLAGIRLLLRLTSADHRKHVRIGGRVIAVVLAPVVLVWNLVVFNVIIVPLLLLAFMRYPIRMSRAWTFIVSMACSLYGLALTLHQLAYMANPEQRPRYAVTWQPEQIAANSTMIGRPSCTCGCDYPINFNVCMNLATIGFVTIIKSIFIAFRCLKGLRRSQWANLLSVLFPVPITMYEVDWRQPDGQPIRYRVEGIPVQAEVAFDPFAMMDEQPESVHTTIHLKPEPLHRYELVGGQRVLVPPSRNFETPAAPPMPAGLMPLGVDGHLAGHLETKEMEYIGCCGFPWPTGGRQVVLTEDFLDTLSAVPTLSDRGSPQTRRFDDGDALEDTLDPRDLPLHLSTKSFGSSPPYSPAALSGASLDLRDAICTQHPLAGQSPRTPRGRIQEPRGRGAPGAALSPREVPRPRDHSPPRWDGQPGGLPQRSVAADADRRPRRPPQRLACPGFGELSDPSLEESTARSES